MEVAAKAAGSKRRLQIERVIHENKLYVFTHARAEVNERFDAILTAMDEAAAYGGS